MPSGWSPRDYVAPGSGWEDDDPVWHVFAGGDPTHLPTAIAAHLTAVQIRAGLIARYGTVDKAIAATGVSRSSLNNALGGRGQWSMRVLTELAWRVGAHVIPTPHEIVDRLQVVATRQHPVTGTPGLPSLTLDDVGSGRHRPPRGT